MFLEARDSDPFFYVLSFVTNKKHAPKYQGVENAVPPDFAPKCALKVLLTGETVANYSVHLRCSGTTSACHSAVSHLPTALCVEESNLLLSVFTFSSVYHNLTFLSSGFKKFILFIVSILEISAFRIAETEGIDFSCLKVYRNHFSIRASAFE